MDDYANHIGMFNLGLRCICLRLFLDRIISGKANTTNISISPPFGDGTSITFYAMCDAPYTDHERENILPYQMQNLSDSAAFLVHLGDLQSRRVDECQEYAYQTASDILKQSRIPVFVIPGGGFVVADRGTSMKTMESSKEVYNEWLH